METKRQKGERPIEINGVYWGWMVGKSNVVIFDPDRKKTVVPKATVMAEYQLGDKDLRVTPGEIGRYIRNHLVNHE